MSIMDPKQSSAKIHTEEQNGLKIRFIPTFLPAIILALAIFIYVYLFEPPPLQPEIHDVREEWWGPHPIDIASDVIRPYNVEFPDVIIDDLKERLLHRRPFNPPFENTGFTYGFNSAFLTRVLDFWQTGYNFKDRERFLNKYTHFITNIQGLDIHYIHVQPEAPQDTVKIPILLIHGWPSSIREFYEIIPLLTSHRSNKDFVFEVIAPSLPGYGFSQAPIREGMGPIHIAVILHNLMKRIGHYNYYVHGGNFGGALGSVMTTLFQNNVTGAHLIMPSSISAKGTEQGLQGELWSPSISKSEPKDREYPWTKPVDLLEVSGYYHYYMQPTKPDTIGIALSESPAGLAAYILEKFTSSSINSKATDGRLLTKASLTHLLDNVMIYWVTNCITNTMRYNLEYYSDMAAVDYFPSKVPIWFIKFKYYLPSTPEDKLKRKYHNLLGLTIVQDEAKFPAMEHSQILANDIYTAVAKIRSFLEKTGKAQTSTKNLSTEPKVPASEKETPKKEPKIPTVYDFTVKDIQGHEVSLEKYKGNVLIIVNVASQCGYTDTHYTQLNELYEKYASKGLRILAFPCNQFGYQEPGTHNEILQFTKKRNVKFDIFEKIEVNGQNTHPLWQFLKNSQKGSFGDFIKWNFSKFIIDRNGFPVGRFGPNVDPLDLEPYLTEYW